MENYVQESVDRIREQAGDRPVFCSPRAVLTAPCAPFCWGGRSAAKAAPAAHRQNGLMRKNESATVVAELKKRGLGASLHFADDSRRFLDAWRALPSPKKKRRIIGDTFIDVFRDEAGRLDLSGCLLAQGTIYRTRLKREAQSAPTSSRRTTTACRSSEDDRPGAS